MELKTARLTILVDPNKKAAFEQLCARLDLTPSQVVRQLIREFLKANGEDYVPSGARPLPAATRSPAPPAPARTAAKASVRGSTKKSPSLRKR